MTTQSNDTQPQQGFTEDMIKDESYREKIIREMINGQENINRKLEALRRHEIYRDKNAKWVMLALANEGYKKETLAQMANRVANISFARKVINKLAQTYSGGVDRKTDKDGDQETMDKLSDLLQADQRFKKADRYRQLFKNCALQVVPVASHLTRDDGKPLYNLAVKVYAPWEYDVIPYHDDPTRPCVFVLADFPERFRVMTNYSPDAYARGASGYRVPEMYPDTADRRQHDIADDPSDAGTNEATREFIWWSPNYHFTTDSKGKIKPHAQTTESTEPDSGIKNPIGRLPIINITGDQDGHFWAQGGEDVVESSILINKLLTDNNYISFVQGWGQLVIAAKEIPKKLEGGPDKAFCFEVNPGDPTPVVAFEHSAYDPSKALDNVRAMIALLLTTNDLASNAVSAQLDVRDLASGVALLIQGAEHIGDVKDVQKVFQDAEPEFWDIEQKWHAKFAESKSLVPELQELTPLSSGKMTLKFHEVKPPISETDKVNTLLLRKQLGIDTTLDLIKRDNPDLTDEEAQLKLQELKDEQQQKQLDAIDNMKAQRDAGVGAFAPGGGNDNAQQGSGNQAQTQNQGQQEKGNGKAPPPGKSKGAPGGEKAGGKTAPAKA